jgi:hypothetical protein
MPEEKIKLALDYGESKKDSFDLAGALDKVKAAADAVGGEFGELVGKSAEAGKSIASISTTAAKADVETKASLGSLAEKAGSLFQAFKGGDLAEIGSGVSSLMAMVPALAPFALGVAAVGSAAAIAWPVLKEWGTALSKLDTGKLKDATTELNEYAKALEKASAALKESDTVKAAREADKAAAEAPGKKQKERADTFGDLTKGREEKTLEEVVDAMDPGRLEREEKIEQIKAEHAAKREAMLGKAKKQGRSDIWIELEDQYLARQAREKMDTVGDGAKAQKDAEDLLAKAKAGDAGALKKLQDILPEGSTTREVARMSSPEAQDEARAGKRDVAEQEKKHGERQKQNKEKEAAYATIPGRIKADIAKKDAEAIERSESAARGRAGGEADQEATRKFLASGKPMPGFMTRPGSATPEQQERGFNRMREGALKRLKSRERDEAGKKRHARPPTREQERSSPAPIKPLADIVGATLQDVSAQNAEIHGMLQQLRMMQANNRAGIQNNRSQASNGTI